MSGSYRQSTECLGCFEVTKYCSLTRSLHCLPYCYIVAMVSVAVF